MESHGPCAFINFQGCLDALFLFCLNRNRLGTTVHSVKYALLLQYALKFDCCT